jgi:hypothetical protein
MNRFLLILVAALLFGCAKNATEPNDGNNNPIDTTKAHLHTVPPAGSIFEYKFSKITPGEDSIARFEVLATGLEIRGKKNVSRFVLGQFSLFVAYEPTGDFSMLGLYDDSVWLPMPVVSKKQAILPPITIRYSGSDHYSTSEWVSTPFRQNDLVVNGKLLKGYEIELIEIEKDYDPAGVLENTDRDTLYFTWSHDIGFWTRYRQGADDRLDLIKYPGM